MEWSPTVIEFIKKVQDADFVSTVLISAEETNPPQPIWEHSILPEERGLEVWMGQLAQYGRHAYTTAAAAAARYAYPIVLERGADMAEEFGFHEDAVSMDGESPGMQVKRVEAWLEEPTEENLMAVEMCIDPTRQLNVWDEDMYPADDGMWFWFYEVPQLAAYAATTTEEWKEGRRNESYTWPAQVCAARAVVCALKAIRIQGGNITEDLKTLVAIIAKAFGL